MKAYDAAPREFEHAGLTFELVISATCFAQVKRHRMATITVQNYDPALGVTIPPSIAAVGMETPFREICARTEETWEQIRRIVPAAAAYILTNAHRRRVMIAGQPPASFTTSPASGRTATPNGISGKWPRGWWSWGGRRCRSRSCSRRGKDGFDALYAQIFADETDPP